MMRTISKYDATRPLNAFTDDAVQEIDASVITSRRTRGKKVDYTSEEALKKAGLKPENAEDDEEEA